MHALVTGSSSGIGAAVARRLLADGWLVHGWDLADATIRHERFSAQTVDLCNDDRVDTLLAALLGEGTPHALVHAAGVLRTAPLGALQSADGERMWRLHVHAATRLANAVLPAMRAAGRGRVLLIGSRVSHGMPGRSQYAASKAALLALARSWAGGDHRAGDHHLRRGLVAAMSTARPLRRCSPLSRGKPAGPRGAQ